MKENSILKVEIELTDEYIQSRFLETGQMPAHRQTVEYDLTQATPDARQAIFRAAGDKLNFSTAGHYPQWTRYNGIPSIDVLAEIVKADLDVADDLERTELTAKTLEKIAAIRKAIDEGRAELPGWCRLDKQSQAKRLGVDLSAYEQALAEYGARQPEFAARDAETKRKMAEYDARKKVEQEAEKERQEAEKRAWIETNGSEYLKRACIKHDFDCQRQYVTERAAMEAPGYVVDFGDNAEWRSRSCPSEVALDELEKMQATGIGHAAIVWLTCPVGDDDYNFDPCEAVTVRDYLGKYDLVKEM